MPEKESDDRTLVMFVREGDYRFGAVATVSNCRAILFFTWRDLNVAELQQREGVSDKRGAPAHASSSDMSCPVIKRVPLRKVR
jgi:hypothetical protein